MQTPDLTIAPSTARRGFMIVIAGSLGALFIMLAFSTPSQSVVWRIFFMAIGAAVLAFVPYFYRSTALGITLTQDALMDGNGRELCKLEDIDVVERGAFAFKPSNGFLIRLKDPADRAWAPGIWWRFGRKIGVGGVLAANQTKAMAEAIAMRQYDGPELKL